MVKVIEGKKAVLGRLASYAAKEALKGEEIAIVNCSQIIITGNEKSIKKDFEIKRGRVGSSQKGPKHSKLNERIVKRVVRGMLPNHRGGRGRVAYKKIKCYSKIPEELKDYEMVIIKGKKMNKFSEVKKFAK
ncbi:50S ribosomal protein L13 [Candidatus Pacearchaeota archaeon]|nr:50S ribosomal protein L13 [Candidatus Pacearchaeota archaeon]